MIAAVLMTERLGPTLAAYRRAAKLGQAAAARLAGVDPSHLSRVEMRGRESRIPSATLIQKLAEIYGLKRNEVLELQQMRRREMARA